MEQTDDSPPSQFIKLITNLDNEIISYFQDNRYVYYDEDNKHYSIYKDDFDDDDTYQFIETINRQPNEVLCWLVYLYNKCIIDSNIKEKTEKLVDMIIKHRLKSIAGRHLTFSFLRSHLSRELSNDLKMILTTIVVKVFQYQCTFKSTKNSDKFIFNEHYGFVHFLLKDIENKQGYSTDDDRSVENCLYFVGVVIGVVNQYGAQREGTMIEPIVDLLFQYPVRLQPLDRYRIRMKHIYTKYTNQFISLYKNYKEMGKIYFTDDKVLLHYLQESIEILGQDCSLILPFFMILYRDVIFKGSKSPVSPTSSFHHLAIRHVIMNPYELIKYAGYKVYPYLSSIMTKIMNRLTTQINVLTVTTTCNLLSIILDIMYGSMEYIGESYHREEYLHYIDTIFTTTIRLLLQKGALNSYDQIKTACDNLNKLISIAKEDLSNDQISLLVSIYPKLIKKLGSPNVYINSNTRWRTPHSSFEILHQSFYDMIDYNKSKTVDILMTSSNMIQDIFESINITKTSEEYDENRKRAEEAKRLSSLLFLSKILSKCDDTSLSHIYYDTIVNLLLGVLSNCGESLDSQQVCAQGLSTIASSSPIKFMNYYQSTLQLLDKFKPKKSSKPSRKRSFCGSPYEHSKTLLLKHYQSISELYQQLNSNSN